MGDSDEEYVPEDDINMEEQVQELGPRKSRVHHHTITVIDAATGKQKLSCNYCPKRYSYCGGNTSCLLQHFRVTHPDVPQVVSDFRKIQSLGFCKLKQNVPSPRHLLSKVSKI